MILRFSRLKIYSFSIGLVFFLILLDRVEYILSSKAANGRVIEIKKWSTQGKYGGRYTAPIIKFSTDDYIITFQGVTNMEAYVGEKVNVLYNPSNQVEASVFNFIGFWLTPLIFLLIPIMIITAFVFSFFKKNVIYSLEIGKKIRLNKINKDEFKKNKLLDKNS